MGADKDSKKDLMYQAQRWVRMFYLFIIPAVAIPALMWVLPWRPDGETWLSWFQRSGAIMIVLALAAEFPVLNLFQALNPSGYVSLDFTHVEERYCRYPRRMSIAVFAVGSLGTLISAYGDLLFELGLYWVWVR